MSEFRMRNKKALVHRRQSILVYLMHRLTLEKTWAKSTLIGCNKRRVVTQCATSCTVSDISGVIKYKKWNHENIFAEQSTATDQYFKQNRTNEKGIFGTLLGERNQGENIKRTRRVTLSYWTVLCDVAAQNWSWCQFSSCFLEEISKHLRRVGSNWCEKVDFFIFWKLMFCKQVPVVFKFSCFSGGGLLFLFLCLKKGVPYFTTP